MSLGAASRQAPNRSVESADELSNVPTGSLVDGDRGFVATDDSEWILLKASTDALSADVVPSHESEGGTYAGRWVRAGVVQSLSQQATWYIDTTNGNDANDGATFATALKTVSEWKARTGPVITVAAMDVYILGAVTEAVNFDQELRSAKVTIHGYTADADAVRETATITAVTAFNRAANTYQAIQTDVALTPATYALALARTVDAGNNTIMGWIIAALGGNVYDYNGIEDDSANYAPATSPPVVGATVEILTTGAFTGAVNISPKFTGSGSWLCFQDLFFIGATTLNAPEAPFQLADWSYASIVFRCCMFFLSHRVARSDAEYLNCKFTAGPVVSDASSLNILYGCGAGLNSCEASVVRYREDFYLIPGEEAINIDADSLVELYTIAAYASAYASPIVTLGEIGAKLAIRGAVYGDIDTGAVWEQEIAGTSVVYDTTASWPPSIAHGANDYIILGAGDVWASLPQIVASSLTGAFALA